MKLANVNYGVSRLLGQISLALTPGEKPAPLHVIRTMIVTTVGA